MKGLFFRIVKQMLGDRRSLALILTAPLLILGLLYLLLGDSSYTPKITVDSTVPDAIVRKLEQQNSEVFSVGQASEALDDLKSGNTDAVVSLNGDGLSVIMLDASGSKAASVTKALKSGAGGNSAGGLSISYLYGNTDSSLFNSLGYMLLGVLSFFFVFIISGISFVRERSSGTLERLMLTPIRRWHVVAGYTLGFGFFAVLQSILIILFTKYVLRMEFAGSVFLAMLTMTLLAFTAVSMGALVSIFSNSEFQVMQFIPIVIIPQIFFSGIISIDTLPFGLGKLAYMMPVYYGCTALERVLIRGAGIGDVAADLLILLVFIAALFALNTVALKKYRKV